MSNYTTKRKLSLEVLEKNIPSHLRYILLVALNDFETSHNLLSADMQRHLLEGDYIQALESLDKYLESSTNLSNAISQMQSLVKKEINRDKEMKSPKPKK